jgi:branched-chain amino acid transport system ATP-binding protein
MLDIVDIHTYYGESHVLQGLSLDVVAGQVVAVLGRNGVGKTTLARSVMAFTPPRRGQIRFKGRTISHWSAHRIAREGIAIVPQGRRIFASLTVREHLEIGARTPPGRPPAWSIARLYERFPRLGERCDTRAGNLSGGERQMLAIARALVANPDLIVMDEPTEGLSPPMVAQVGTLIGELASAGTGILLVEQNLGFALGVAHHVHVMDKGRLVWSGSPEALAADAQVRSEYLGV